MSLTMFVGTSKEKFFYHNTLLCVVRSLQGQNITVDLRNDTYVCGCVESVDGFMNVCFSKAVYCDPQYNEYFFERLFVQARSIRYVHIPEDKSIVSLIKSELMGNRKPKDPTQKKNIEKSRKAKKALKQHMDIVASLETSTKS